MTISVLFVCLGNICRSPLAEAALRRECQVSGRSMIIDSAGTGDWHVGQAPDDRAISVALKNGVEIAHLRARQVQRTDFQDFDHLIALDNQNLRDLRDLSSSNMTDKLSLLTSYIDGRSGDDIADPYYGNDEAFDQTWAEVTDAARVLVQTLTSDGN